MIIRDKETFDVFKQIIDNARDNLPNYNTETGDKIIKENILPLIKENERLPFEYDDFYLARLKTFKLVLNDNMSFESMGKVLNNMEYILDTARHLKTFELIYDNRNDPSIILSGVTNFLYHVSNSVSTFNLSNISVDKLEESFFYSKFELSNVNLNNTNINDLNLFRSIRPTTQVSLINNDYFTSQHKNEILNFAIKENRRLTVSSNNPVEQESCNEINEILYMFNPNLYDNNYNRQDIHEINLSTFIKNNKIITDNMYLLNYKQFNKYNNISESYDNKKTIYIYADKNINFKELFALSNDVNNINDTLQNEQLSLMILGEKNDVINTLDTGLKAEGTIYDVEKMKDLNMKELKNKNIKYISFKSNYGNEYQKKFYKFKELDVIQKKIHAIEKKVMPFFLNQKNITEKEIFTRLYLELGRTMEYDDNACALIEKGNRNEIENNIVSNSQNLTAGILNKKTVCAGFADIIQRICADFNIEADFVAANDRQGGGHAWNRVKLDGKYYFVDLTWDLDNIKKSKTPKLEYFLKSLKDFKHEEYTNYPQNFQNEFDITKCECNESISYYEEKMLFNKANQNVVGFTLEKLNDIANEFSKILKPANSKDISVKEENYKNNENDKTQSARKQQVLNELNKELNRIDQLENIQNDLDNQNTIQPTEININEKISDVNISNISNISNNSNIQKNKIDITDNMDDFDY